MKLYLALLLIILPIVILSAQSAIFMGIKGSENQDLQQTSISETLIRDQSISRSLGIFGGMIFKEHWLVEAGMVIKSYYIKSYPSKLRYSPNLEVSSRSFQAFQIPVSMGYRIPLVANRLFLSPKLGVSWVYNRNYGEKSNYSDQYEIQDLISRTISANHGLTKHFGLLETGLDFEFFPHPRFSVVINGSYFRSFADPISNQRTIYQINDGPVREVNTYINGDYLNLGVGFKYWIFNTAQKEESRI